jgi:hypothetical protein
LHYFFAAAKHEEEKDLLTENEKLKAKVMYEG